MSIIIYHTEPHIDSDRVEALRRFYGCVTILICKYHLDTPPDDTLVLLRVGANGLPEHCKLQDGTRVIDINTAFAELNDYTIKIMDECLKEPSIMKTMINQFIAEQRDIFTIDDVLAYMRLDKQKDATLYAIPTINKLLEDHGCSKELITIYTPRNQPAEDTSIKYRRVEPFEIAL